MSDNKVDFTGFFQTKLRKDLISDVETVDGLLKSRKLNDSVKKVVEENKEDILFRFKGSFIVGSNFLIGTSKKEGGRKIDFSQLSNITYKDGGIFGVSGYFINDKHFDNYIENPSSGKRLFKLFKVYINQSIFSEVDNNKTRKIDNTLNQELEQTNDSIDKPKTDINKSTKDSNIGLDTSPNGINTGLKVELNGESKEVFIDTYSQTYVKEGSNNLYITNETLKKLNWNDFTSNVSSDQLVNIYLTNLDTDSYISSDLHNFLFRNSKEIKEDLKSRIEDFIGEKIPTYTRWITLGYQQKTVFGIKKGKPFESIMLYLDMDKNIFNINISVKVDIDRQETRRLFPFVNNLEEVPLTERTWEWDSCSYKKLLGEISEYKSTIGVDIELLDRVVEIFNEILRDQRMKLNKLSEQIGRRISILDQDNNGLIDISETDDDFMKLVEKKQFQIIEIDKTYLQNLMKVGNYLSNFKEEISNIFNSINQEEEVLQKEWWLDYLEDRINDYNQLSVHSLCMIVSLTDGKNLLTFYKIYEIFDQLNVFNSNWENKLSEKFDNLEDHLKKLISSNKKVSEGLRNLTNVTQEGFKGLEQNITSELSSINSSIKFNNLLTTIQTYQNYKINKNTKSLRG